jgi:hypothetical protein
MDLLYRLHRCSTFPNGYAVLVIDHTTMQQVLGERAGRKGTASATSPESLGLQLAVLQCGFAGVLARMSANIATNFVVVLQVSEG